MPLQVIGRVIMLDNREMRHCIQVWASSAACRSPSLADGCEIIGRHRCTVDAQHLDRRIPPLRWAGFHSSEGFELRAVCVPHEEHCNGLEKHQIHDASHKSAACLP